MCIEFVEEDRKGVIYGLHNGDHVIRYIGQTVKIPATRMREHRNFAAKGVEWPVYKWMRKHGPENIQMCILEVFADPELLDVREIALIAQYRQDFPKSMLNVTDGGGGVRGYAPSEETRAKLSKAREGNQNAKGFKHTEETKAKVSAANKRRVYEKRGPLSDEHKANLSAALKEKWAKDGHHATGRTLSEDHKAKLSVASAGNRYAAGQVWDDDRRAMISAVHKGKPKSDATKLKMAEGAHRWRHVDKGIVKEGCQFCEA